MNATNLFECSEKKWSTFHASAVFGDEDAEVIYGAFQDFRSGRLFVILLTVARVSRTTSPEKLLEAQEELERCR